jgi:putative oxygen-independent coproporphyrinogen III oxidase
MSDLHGGPLGGIYVHVPFCLRKCSYCDFYSIADLSLTAAYLEALSSEIAAADPGPRAFDTIYIGGGTPSLLAPAEVEAIVAGLFSKFRFERPVEVTLEANPGTVGFEKLRGFRSAGVNRLNLGVQSFQEQNLERLGRIHSAGQAQAALESARRAGFETVGLDLIYGLPGQTRRGWAADLESALAYAPDHIACYMLTVEPGTPLAEDRRCGRFRPAPAGAAADLFRMTSEFLAARGFRHYEVSNFARCGADGAARISRHNCKYWTHAAYLGFGPAAHSFLPPTRFWNQRDVKGYVEALQRGGRPVAGKETLTVEQEMMEAVLLGMRTAAGVDLSGFRNRFGVDFMQVHGAAAAELASQGLLRLEAGRCAPTLRGMLYVNTVTAALV